MRRWVFEVLLPLLFMTASWVRNIRLELVVLSSLLLIERSSNQGSLMVQNIILVPYWCTNFNQWNGRELLQSCALWIILQCEVEWWLWMNFCMLRRSILYLSVVRTCEQTLGVWLVAENTRIDPNGCSILDSVGWRLYVWRRTPMITSKW